MVLAPILIQESKNIIDDPDVNSHRYKSGILKCQNHILGKEQLLEWFLSGAEISGYLHTEEGKQIPLSLEKQILVCEET